MKFKRNDRKKKEVELIFPLLRGTFTLSYFCQIKLISILILFVCFIYFEINDFELKIFRILSF